jgi:hypothetical protein
MDCLRAKTAVRGLDRVARLPGALPGDRDEMVMAFKRDAPARSRVNADSVASLRGGLVTN